jgi:hypothetical protein
VCIGCNCIENGWNPIASASSTESKCIATGEVPKELQKIHQLAAQFGPTPGCIPVGCDNNAVMSLVVDPLSAARAKHIDIIHHHVEKRVQMQQMHFSGIPTRINTSDVFTKPLAATVLLRITGNLLGFIHRFEVRKSMHVLCLSVLLE